METELSIDEMKKMIANAPDYCPITGLRKCDAYMISNNVVYLPNPAYDAFTLPYYDEDEQSFYHTRYDMDDDFLESKEYICDLEDLKDSPNFELIKQTYHIK
jgi:hypothetical protein